MFIKINRANIYYEVYGEGDALIMAHGNGEDCEIFYPAVEVLKRYFKVYLLDTRGHGKSSGKKRVYHYDLFADDVAKFIKKLKIQNPIFYGFSDGAITGLLLARDYNVVKAVILSGVNTDCNQLNNEDVLNELRYYAQFGDKNTQALIQLVFDEPKIPLDSLRNIDVPVYVTAASDELISLEDTQSICDAIPNAKLVVVPDSNHVSYVKENAQIAQIILDFLRKA